MKFNIPEPLVTNCQRTPETTSWLEMLPDAVRELQGRWGLTLGTPFASQAAWVAPAELAGGTSAVLKVGMPHMEGQHEVHGLRFWDADPTVRLLDSDVGLNAMLLERCEPGAMLRTLPELEQDIVIADLLRRLWRSPPEPNPFRPLTTMLAHWRAEALDNVEQWPDSALVREGLQLFDELPRTASAEVLLATDLHAGNVLSAERQPWLVIDPKPFVGDPAYGATQHLLNCAARLRADPGGTIRRFADLLDLDPERVRLWTFARAAAAPMGGWKDQGWLTFARALAP